jgi:hypothetical protein
MPDINVYLEHLAVDANGELSPEFYGYKKGMVWRRQLHAKNETTLPETTLAQLWNGQAQGHDAQFAIIKWGSLKIAPQSIAVAREPLNGNIKQNSDEKKRQSKIHCSPKASQPSRAWLAQFVSHHHLAATFF